MQEARTTMICHACNNTFQIDGFISRASECPHCSADVHCCLNCDNYDPAAHNRCREPQAEWVSNREKANFCGFFKPNRLKAAGKATDSRGDARRAFDSLFKS